MRNKLIDILDCGTNLVYKNKDFEKIFVSGITDDSRKVENGFLFVAVKGLTVDGHKYIDKAIENGAVAIVGEENISNLSVPYIKVDDSRKALGMLASRFYDDPSEKLTVIGVTGTDGKTTTSNLIYEIIKESGGKVGLVSTISAKIDGKEYDTGFHVTNPDPVSLQKFLSKMVGAKCKYAVLEVTSHGLDQLRVEGVKFDIAVLTNITHEHIDYHKTIENYRKSKSKLFSLAEKLVVLNADDESENYLNSVVKKNTEVIRYSIINTKADVFASNISEEKNGISYGVNTSGLRYKINTSLIGKYNISNSLAAISVCNYLGINEKYIQQALSNPPQLSGRMEEIENEMNFRTIVDFAHTPNSLKLVLETLKKQTKNKLIVVFGCAGRRDVEKRKMMPKVSIKYADISVFTAEDPRDEDLNDILEVMKESAISEGGIEFREDNYRNLMGNSTKRFICISDRGRAIWYAISKLASDGDIVVICGKGHEKSMCFGNIEYEWSDQDAVKLALGDQIKTIDF